MIRGDQFKVPFWNTCSTGLKSAYSTANRFLSRHERGLWIASVVGVTLAVAYSMIAYESDWLRLPAQLGFSQYGPTQDRVDVPLLLGSLARKPNFPSTFSWWHESWVPTVPFWRPLTVQVFWLEKHFFTLDRYDRWMWLSFVLDILSVASFGAFVKAFTGRRDVALLSVIFYCIPRPMYIAQFVAPSYPPAMLSLDAWKNQPDLWVDLLTFTAMNLALVRRYWAALATCFLSVCFKESGWFSFLLCMTLVVYRGELRRLTPSFLVAGVAVVLLLAGMRWSAGPAVMVGYHMGTNNHWLQRYLSVAGGYAVDSALIFHAAGCLGLGLFLVGVFWRSMKPAWLLLSILAIAIAVATAEAARFGSSIYIGLASLFDVNIIGVILQTGILSALWLAAALTLARSQELRKPALFAVGCSLLTALSYAAATQVLDHVLHLATAFQSWLVAMAALATWQALMRLRFVDSSRPDDLGSSCG